MSSKILIGYTHDTQLTYLEWVYKRQVIQCDIVVVILDIAEGFLMIPHQCVDLAVFPLLNLVNLGFPAQLKLLT